MTNEILEAARAALDAFGGTKKIDALDDDQKNWTLRAIATSIMLDVDCHIDTAKHHLAKAMAEKGIAQCQE